MVHGAHMDVVHVHEQAAAGALRHLGQKLPLRYDGVAEAQVARRVLDEQHAQHPLEALGQRREPVHQLAVITSYSIHYTKLYDK